LLAGSVRRLAIYQESMLKNASQNYTCCNSIGLAFNFMDVGRRDSNLDQCAAFHGQSERFWTAIHIQHLYIRLHGSAKMCSSSAGSDNAKCTGFHVSFVDLIRSNCKLFSERFDLNRESKIMWSTSLDFDPSFLELLMAFELDCSLFIVDELDLKRVWQFASMIKTVRPSFLQVSYSPLNVSTYLDNSGGVVAIFK
jgi:hypothetical protein